MTPMEIREINSIAQMIAGVALAAVGAARRGFLGFTLIATGAGLLMMGKRSGLLDGLKEALMPEEGAGLTDTISSGIGSQTGIGRRQDVGVQARSSGSYTSENPQRGANDSPTKQPEVTVRKAAGKPGAAQSKGGQISGIGGETTRAGAKSGNTGGMTAKSPGIESQQNGAKPSNGAGERGHEAHRA